MQLVALLWCNEIQRLTYRMDTHKQIGKQKNSKALL